MKSSLRSTFFSMLGYRTVEMVTPSPEQIELIKQAMMDVLTERGRQSHPRMVRQIRYATDVEGLWYLRSDLMQALSSMLGETAAHQEMERLTPIFTRYLPPSMTRRNARPRP